MRVTKKQTDFILKRIKKANKKFYNRFTQLEKLILLDKKIINNLSLDELMKYWKKVKNAEK